MTQLLFAERRHLFRSLAYFSFLRTFYSFRKQQNYTCSNSTIATIRYVRTHLIYFFVTKTKNANEIEKEKKTIEEFGRIYAVFK